VCFHLLIQAIRIAVGCALSDESFGRPQSTCLRNPVTVDEVGCDTEQPGAGVVVGKVKLTSPFKSDQKGFASDIVSDRLSGAACNVSVQPGRVLVK